MERGRINQLFQKTRQVLHLDELSPGVRRWVVGIIGGTILLAGLAMTILPGPAFIVIPLGLAMLGTEFAWARHCVQKARKLLTRAKQKVS
jgi:Putative transmembrane protein (PGPGW)